MTDVYTQDDLDAARDEGREAGLQAGRDEEQSRVAGILNLESATGKIDATLRTAIETGQSVEDAGKFLAAVPEQKGNGFLTAMGQIDNPQVSADTGSETEQTDQELVAEVVQLHKGDKS